MDTNINPYNPSIAPADLAFSKQPLHGYSKVACIFFIILGALGLMGTLQSVVGIAVSLSGANGAMNTANPFPGAMIVQIAFVIVNCIVSVAMIIAGVLGLKQKQKGAMLIRSISAFMLMFKVLETAFASIFIYASKDATIQQIKQQSAQRPNNAPFDIEDFMGYFFVAMVAFAIFIGLFMFVFYLLTFLHFNKKQTQSQFN